MNIATGLLIHRITRLCQLQDLGRIGYQRYGVSRSGAMDPRSLRLANILAGNPGDEACLEFALAGAEFEVTAKRLHFAFVGPFPVLINGEAFSPNASFTLSRGEQLEIGATDGSLGTHGYLAVLGGFAAEPQLGSRSTHLRSGIGGDFAVGAASAATQPTRKRSILPTRLDEAPLAVQRQLPRDLIRRPTRTVRAIPGPQDGLFDEGQIAQFFEATWRIAPSSDRMGYRLEGPALKLEQAGSMISEAVSPGSVQIPPGGQAIVLMPDCGTVGGYPKIATVISVDRGPLAQLRVGAGFGFERVTVEDAQDLLLEEERRLRDIQKRPDL